MTPCKIHAASSPSEPPPSAPSKTQSAKDQESLPPAIRPPPSSSIPDSNFRSSAPCLPTFIFRNPLCSCLSAPSPAAITFCAPTTTPSPPATAFTPTETACSSSNPPPEPPSMPASPATKKNSSYSDARAKRGSSTGCYSEPIRSPHRCHSEPMRSLHRCHSEPAHSGGEEPAAGAPPNAVFVGWDEKSLQQGRTNQNVSGHTTTASDETASQAAPRLRAPASPSEDSPQSAHAHSAPPRTRILPRPR